VPALGEDCGVIVGIHEDGEPASVDGRDLYVGAPSEPNGAGAAYTVDIEPED
jgi:hypothetical protein